MWPARLHHHAAKPATKRTAVLIGLRRKCDGKNDVHELWREMRSQRVQLWLPHQRFKHSRRLKNVPFTRANFIKALADINGLKFIITRQKHFNYFWLNNFDTSEICGSYIGLNKNITHTSQITAGLIKTLRDAPPNSWYVFYFERWGHLPRLVRQYAGPLGPPPRLVRQTNYPSFLGPPSPLPPPPSPDRQPRRQ